MARRQQHNLQQHGQGLTYRSILGAHLLALAIIMWITPKRIGEFFNDLGVRLRDMGWKGMLILSAAISECSSRTATVSPIVRAFLVRDSS